MERDVKYYQLRRAEIMLLLDSPYLPGDFRTILENARDFATKRIQQLTNRAVLRGIIVRQSRVRALDGTQGSREGE